MVLSPATWIKPVESTAIARDSEKPVVMDLTHCSYWIRLVSILFSRSRSDEGCFTIAVFLKDRSATIPRAAAAAAPSAFLIKPRLFIVGSFFICTYPVASVPQCGSIWRLSEEFKSSGPDPEVL